MNPTRPITRLTIYKPVRLWGLRCRSLAPGQYLFEGDLRRSFSRRSDKRAASANMYSVEFIDAKNISRVGMDSSSNCKATLEAHPLGVFTESALEKPGASFDPPVALTTTPPDEVFVITDLADFDAYTVDLNNIHIRPEEVYPDIEATNVENVYDTSTLVRKISRKRKRKDSGQPPVVG